MVVRWWLVIVAVAAVAASVTGIVLALAGSGPDPAACKAAMVRQFNAALASTGAPDESLPPQCKGISGAELQRLADQVLEGK